MSIIRENGEKGKDFFQPFFLDPADREEILGGVEYPAPRSLHHDRLRYAVGDPGKAGQLPVPRAVDIDRLPEEDPLPDGQGAAVPSHRKTLLRNAGRTVTDRSRLREGSRAGGRQRGEEGNPCSAHIPYKNNQG